MLILWYYANHMCRQWCHLVPKGFVQRTVQKRYPFWLTPPYIINKAPACTFAGSFSKSAWNVRIVLEQNPILVSLVSASLPPPCRKKKNSRTTQRTNSKIFWHPNKPRKQKDSQDYIWWSQFWGFCFPSQIWVIRPHSLMCFWHPDKTTAICYMPLKRIQKLLLIQKKAWDTLRISLLLI